MGRRLSVGKSVLKLVLFSIVFHLVYIFSVLDIYFKSPVVHGVQKSEMPLLSRESMRAKRLVFIVGDGLRADKTFQVDGKSGKTNIPFLRKMAEEKGVWGVSHTRVPTESRPGHVAMIAGMYEDVSAVTKGWKSNPVGFDSVFNESRYVWCWGSPDILPMFAIDTPQVEVHTYGAHEEDFASDLTELDSWVFTEVEKFFETLRRGENKTLNELVKEEKTIYFLHLLGIDSQGHAYRPNSEEYLRTIRLVDKGIEKVANSFAEFFGDECTAFVFSSDHGMYDKGSHGDGHPQNTMTPIIAWGAGIRGPKSSASLIDSVGGKVVPSSPLEWSLDHILRVDIEQASIAPLMSAILGIPFPLNSVGTLPLSFLNATMEEKAKLIYSNSIQMFNQLSRWDEMHASRKLFYTTFPLLESIPKMSKQIEQKIHERKFQDSILQSNEMIQICLKGLRYLQTYDRLMLFFFTCAAYILWIVFLSVWVSLLPQKEKNGKSQNTKDVFSLILLAVCYVFLVLEKSNWRYYLYITFPIYLAREIWHELATLLSIYRSLVSSLKNIGNIFVLLMTPVILEITVVGYFKREVFAPCFILLGCWGFFFSPVKQTWLRLFWVSTCLLTSLFPLLPVDFGDSLEMVVFGGVLVFFSSCFFVYVSWVIQQRRISVLTLVQLFVCILSVFSVYHTTISLKYKKGLPLANQMINWGILIYSMFTMFIKRRGHIEMLSNLLPALSSVYILLSISYEVLFFFSFSLTLVAWILMEREIRVSIRGKDTSLNQVRSALFYLLFTYVAFFGTGNIASISSFEISSTYRFITIFNPFIMGAILLFKIMVPFLAVSASFGLINQISEISQFASFFIIIALSNVLSLNFLFLVRDEGSWKDIGMSISHFGISNAHIIFQLIMFSIPALFFN